MDEPTLADIERNIDESLAKAVRELMASQAEAGDQVPAPAASDPLVEAEVTRLFAEYLEAQGLSPDAESALQLDAAFMQRHAGPLTVHVLTGLTAFIAREVADSPVAGQRPPGPTTTLDLSDLLGGLFEPPNEREA